MGGLQEGKLDMVRRIDEAWDHTVKYGGGTFDMLTLDDVHADAWAVGLEGVEMSLDDGFEMFALAYRQACRSSWTEDTAYPIAFGTWVDDGKVYCDVVALVPNVYEAIGLATLQEQLAIYHLKTEETIRLEEV